MERRVDHPHLFQPCREEADHQAGKMTDQPANCLLTATVNGGKIATSITWQCAAIGRKDNVKSLDGNAVFCIPK